jgi:hypothetical protein
MNLLLLVVESIPTYRSNLSTVRAGSPACKPGKFEKLPLLNFRIGEAILGYKILFVLLHRFIGIMTASQSDLFIEKGY